MSKLFDMICLCFDWIMTLCTLDNEIVSLGARVDFRSPNISYRIITIITLRSIGLYTLIFQYYNLSLFVRSERGAEWYGYVSAFETLWSQYPMKLKLVMAYEVEISYGFIRSIMML